MDSRRLTLWLSLAAMAVSIGLAGPARAQTQSGAAPPPPPVTTTPLPPPPIPPAAGSATPPPAAPPATIVQSPPAPTATPPAPIRSTLIPDSGDSSNVDEVVLQAKPVLILSGTSSWDEGLKALRTAFAAIEAELAKAGIAPTGRPVTVFTQTTDDNFRFDAMVPIAAVPGTAPPLPAEMRFGTTPSGKAYRFVHKGPYDDIDSTYETITAYLDAKDILAKDAFIEEYTNDVADPADPNLEINIFVQPK